MRTPASQSELPADLWLLAIPVARSITDGLGGRIHCFPDLALSLTCRPDPRRPAQRVPHNRRTRLRRVPPSNR